MRNCAGDRIIANGDMLLVAMEDMYLYEEFKESML
jgi:ASC-1-like (ASCH) protein